jgi:hypothetical protein
MKFVGSAGYSTRQMFVASIVRFCTLCYCHTIECVPCMVGNTSSEHSNFFNFYYIMLMIANSSEESAKSQQQQHCLHVYLIDHSKPCRTLLQTTANTLHQQDTHDPTYREYINQSASSQPMLVTQRRDSALLCVHRSLYCSIPSSSCDSRTVYIKLLL